MEKRINHTLPIALAILGIVMSVITLVTAACGGDDSPAKPAYCEPGFVGPITDAQRKECEK